MINRNIWNELPKAAIEPLSIEILELEKNKSTYKLERQFCFSKDFIGFKGHFPNNPVVPGVVQISCVRYMCSLFFNKLLHISKIYKVKFIRIITPGQIFKVSTIVKKQPDYIEANFTINLFDIKDYSNHKETKDNLISKGIIYMI